MPAWGYGEVIESNLPAIKVGSLLYGFWPTSSYPIDLKLEPWQVHGHWTEVSKHREEVMTVYNRYTEVASKHSDHDRALVSGVQAVWQCAYLLNSVTFPDKTGVTPIHPLGFGEEWTAQDEICRLRSSSVFRRRARQLEVLPGTSQEIAIWHRMAL